jgi:hypothetical protein
MQRTLIIPPDAYFLWSLLPDTLLNYDKIIVCKSDFEDREDKKDRSRYDHLVATALHQYNESGLIEVWDLKGSINPTTIGLWNAVADYILSEMPSADVYNAGAELLRYWMKLCDAKMMFYSTSEPEFKNVNADKMKALGIIHAIERTGEPPKGSDLIHVVKLSLVKAFVCMEMSEMTKQPFHDLPTLRPIIDLIANFFQGKSSSEALIPNRSAPLANHILMPLYKMASTGVVYDSPSSIRQVLADREDFVTYRRALRELDELYREIESVVNDVDVAQSKFEGDLARIRVFVDSELANIRRKQKLLMFPLAILSSFYIPGLTQLAQIPMEWLEKKQMTHKLGKIKNGDVYKWFYAFQKLTSKPPAAALQADFSPAEEAEHTSWCSGTRPWYYVDPVKTDDS